jgi:molybdopterin molybdotransferase
MIKVEQAQKEIVKHKISLGSETIKITDASKRISYNNIYSPLSHPLFDQSAVDGYAIRFNMTNKAKSNNLKFKIIGEIKTGETYKYALRENEAMRIFTGAAVPSGCKAVVMQEHVEKKDGMIQLKLLPIPGENIRKKGKQINKGQIAIKRGTLLQPSSIGFLTSLGIDRFKAVRLPRIAIISTGCEFIRRNDKLSKGKIYESNSVMLDSLLKEMKIGPEVFLCKDNIKKLISLITRVMEKADIIIISGGVSVGDYDFTETVMKMLKFKIIFHNVLQKPGKPLLFARRGNKAAFGLPGNPRSVLVCFYEYIYPFIFSSMGIGNDKVFLEKVKLPIFKSYYKKEKKGLFLTAKFINDKIDITEGQESHMLQSFIDADGLIYLKEGIRGYKAGEKIEVHLLPK